MSAPSCILIGNESLLIQCAEALLARGATASVIVTRSGEIADWAKERAIPVLAPGKGLGERLAGHEADWLLSIANLDLLPDDVLARARRGAINFHDGPLPAYAGLNAPVWALIAGEKEFAITWHMITGGVDEGDIIAQERFDIAEGETALTLNAKCFEAGLKGFGRVLEGLMADKLVLEKQDLGQRSYFARDKRPEGFARLDFSRPASELARLVRALDHGGYWNPLTLARFEAGGAVYLVTSAGVETGEGAPGEVLDIRADQLLVACGEGALLLSGLKTDRGGPVEVVDFTRVGDVLPAPQTAPLDETARLLAPHDAFWRARLAQMRPARLAFGGSDHGETVIRRLKLPQELTGARALALLAGFGVRLCEESEADIAYRGPASPDLPGYVSGWVPLRASISGDPGENAQRFCAQLEAGRKRPGFALDLFARAPELGEFAEPDIGLSEHGGTIEGCALTLSLDGAEAIIAADSGRIEPTLLDLIEARLACFLESARANPEMPLGEVDFLPATERRMLLESWNGTDKEIAGTQLIHAAFEAQAEKTPGATALVFEDMSLTYDALNRAANRAAHVLIGMGVAPGQPVGLHLHRSPEMLIGALAILKAGGAYVPMDPAFPPERLRHFLTDSGARVVVTQDALAGNIAGHETLCLDSDPRLQGAPESNPQADISPEDLAYLIYTSGSTGTPKGVMVEHRNVANFFTGMDARIDHENGGTWLAVTSLSFDISVLELFYTLARGFTIVLTGDEERTLVAGDSTQGAAHSDRHMDFSLFFWGNDDGVGRQKYELLLEGAKYADQHGFRAVWTPERHFHAFGGPYPNPSVTGAAVAAVTRNLDVRSGSCVAPLHHPARIAEEWAVIDNLTEGRVGLGIAAGWQPHDFVLRPENTPPANKPAMYEAIDTLRKLWRGEAVSFPMADGTGHEVITQPRPVSRELPIWVTTAGNPDTWREAGEIGANVLTHLLGQSIEEVGKKIEIYHTALHKAGFDPADHTVTLMLHTYLAEDREHARAMAEGPMKDYLTSAAGLIKQFAWVFPAFKRPKGVSNAFELDLEVLEPEDMEAILDFAFTRYFEDSGLFGTVEDALRRTEQLKAIGVDEIACLVDYGIGRAEVLESLTHVAKVVARANQPVELAEDDFSIAAQIRRQQVSHMQMTPSMARMLTMNDAARGALAGVSHLYIGGEALPGGLVRELEKITRAPITNMYGPTETTIWSSSELAEPCAGAVNIGRPIANTRLYVLNEALEPVPLGQTGELWIGGAGVTRGYHGQSDLTRERFRESPFRAGERIYRTGDLVRQRLDGRIDFLGRSDFQVKIRGFRIELGEIEAKLEQVAGCPAIVIAREDNPGDTRLVAYLAGKAPDDGALKASLARDLPDYMLPSSFVRLDAFPLTPNRKIDRKALPAPGEAAAPARAFTAPRDETEKRIAEIWSRILGVARIASGDNFFDLGGHSLLAVQAHREIRAAFDMPSLSITDIFRHPTLKALAEKVAGSAAPDDNGAPQQGGAAEDRANAMSRRRAMRANRRR